MIFLSLIKSLPINKAELASPWTSFKFYLRLLILVVLACAFTPGSLGQETTAPASTDTAPPPGAPVETAPAQNTPSTPASYLLRSGDLIRITVFQEDDLTTEARISQSGSIMFPLLGSVQVQGKSVADAQELIRSLLAQKYIVHPHVNLAVLEYSKLWVTVLGEVHTPGNVEVPSDSGMNLLAAIALSGGFTDNADTTRVNIRRTVDGRDTISTVNAAQMARDPNVKAFKVLPGDTITAVKYASQSITILGQVRSPGKINLPREGGLDLLGAVAMAGGFTPDADIAHITVRRTVAGKDVILSVNAKDLTRDSNVGAFMVQPEDSISVPERMF